MTDQLGDIEARIGTVRQLASVIGAMRGIAAVRGHEASARLDGIRTYAATIGDAIAQALALAPPAPAADDADPPQLVIAICAEQGFAGPYNTHVIEAVAGLARCDALIVVGARGLAQAREQHLPITAQLTMASHVDQIGALTNQLTDLVLARVAADGAARVVLVHACPTAPGHSGKVAIRQLLPFDFARFSAPRHGPPPLVQIPVADLLAQLADEYMFAQLCEALTLALAAENEARMRAMVAARDHVAQKLDELDATARRLRQEAITAEVIELATTLNA